ncbi:DUF2461 domain-containing protein [Bacteroidales bacterium OttesenSCG-928-L03]|nr:DUF2461 domain-containing protein [Bacteroidales bacterium OttesenSCG-928-L03]
MFTPKTFEFFAQLLENNNKPWFDEHKSIYQEQVLQPLKDLALALSPAMYQIDSQFDLRPQKMISRIYRDIRFSHDKTPYKQHMWISFQRPMDKKGEDWESFPGFYLEVGAEGVGYGMGLFMPKKKVMDRYRDQVEYDPDSFRKMTQDLLGKHGFELGGEAYKRPLKSDLPDYFQAWIQRKGIYLHKNIPVQDLFFSPDFVPYLEQELRLLAPLYDFFVDICE